MRRAGVRRPWRGVKYYKYVNCRLSPVVRTWLFVKLEGCWHAQGEIFTYSCNISCQPQLPAARLGSPVNILGISPMKESILLILFILQIFDESSLKAGITHKPHKPSPSKWCKLLVMRGQAARGHTLTILLSSWSQLVFFICIESMPPFTCYPNLPHYVIYVKEQSIFRVIKMVWPLRRWCGAAGLVIF